MSSVSIGTVPQWLHCSDAWVSLSSTLEHSEGTDTLGADLGADLGAVFELLPVCDLNCTDGVQMYKVMGAWCLSWNRVPKNVFFPLWVVLDETTRQTLLFDCKYYQQELDGGWLDNMFDRDDVDMMSWVYQGKSSVSEYVWKFTTKYKSDECIEPRCHAVINGAIQCLTWLINSDPMRDKNNDHLVSSAIEYDQVNSLACLHKNGWTITNNDFINAIEYSLNCVKYMSDHGFTHPQGLTLAAVTGQVEIMAYLYERGYSWSPNSLVKAAEGDHLDCVKYAHEHGCTWSTDGAEMACKTLPCLQYLHENGCPWNPTLVYVNAFRYDHLLYLQYAHTHGCPVPIMVHTIAGFSLIRPTFQNLCLPYFMQTIFPHCKFPTVAGGYTDIQIQVSFGGNL